MYDLFFTILRQQRKQHLQEVQSGATAVKNFLSLFSFLALQLRQSHFVFSLLDVLSSPVPDHQQGSTYPTHSCINLYFDDSQ
jgi:hypothetical protein